MLSTQHKRDSEAQQKADWKTLTAKKKERQANREFLECVDNQLERGCGLSLLFFKPVVRVKMLSADERRYYVYVDDPVTGETCR